MLLGTMLACNDGMPHKTTLKGARGRIVSGVATVFPIPGVTIDKEPEEDSAVAAFIETLKARPSLHFAPACK